jgi:hypothetical protein
MNDIEFTKKLENLTWKIDFEAGTCISDLVHFKIVPGDGYTDLKLMWASPSIPLVMEVLFDIQRSAVAAFKKASRDE